MVTNFGLFGKPSDSSIVSRTVVSAFTMTFAGLYHRHIFSQDKSDVNLGMKAWVAFLSGLLMYIIACFLKVNSGAMFPSDCLFSLLPVFLVFFIFTIVTEIKEKSDFCTKSSYGSWDNICYYNLETPCA